MRLVLRQGVLQLGHPLLQIGFTLFEKPDAIGQALNIGFRLMMLGFPLVTAFFKEADQFAPRALVDFTFGRIRHGLSPRIG